MTPHPQIARMGMRSPIMQTRLLTRLTRRSGSLKKEEQQRRRRTEEERRKKKKEEERRRKKKGRRKEKNKKTLQERLIFFCSARKPQESEGRRKHARQARNRGLFFGSFEPCSNSFIHCTRTRCFDSTGSVSQPNRAANTQRGNLRQKRGFFPSHHTCPTPQKLFDRIFFFFWGFSRKKRRKKEKKKRKVRQTFFPRLYTKIVFFFWDFLLPIFASTSLAHFHFIVCVFSARTLFLSFVFFFPFFTTHAVASGRSRSRARDHLGWAVVQRMLARADLWKKKTSVCWLGLCGGFWLRFFGVFVCSFCAVLLSSLFVLFCLFCFVCFVCLFVLFVVLFLLLFLKRTEHGPTASWRHQHSVEFFVESHEAKLLHFVHLAIKTTQ